MAILNITAKVGYAVNVKFQNTFDPHADFNQIILRVRNGKKFVNVRVVDLGDAISLEFWDDVSKKTEFKVENKSFNQQVIHNTIDLFLN